jgi:hypothetical protein
MSFLDAREHGSKVGSGGPASAQNEVSYAQETAVFDLCAPSPQIITASVVVHDGGRSYTAGMSHFVLHWLCRPSTGGRGCAGWRWKPSTSRRTPTSCATTWASMSAACVSPCTTMRATTLPTPRCVQRHAPLALPHLPPARSIIQHFFLGMTQTPQRAVVLHGSRQKCHRPHA